jgi:hypothetical protein
MIHSHLPPLLVNHPSYKALPLGFLKAQFKAYTFQEAASDCDFSNFISMCDRHVSRAEFSGARSLLNIGALYPGLVFLSLSLGKCKLFPPQMSLLTS